MSNFSIVLLSVLSSVAAQTMAPTMMPAMMPTMMPTMAPSAATDSLCDKYTSAIFGAAANTQANQESLLTLLVNTAVAGYVDISTGALSATPLNADVALGKTGPAALNVAVNSILNLSGGGTIAMEDGTGIYTGDFLKYFDGSSNTTSVGG
jgi:hypothetical protein